MMFEGRVESRILGLRSEKLKRQWRAVFSEVCRALYSSKILLMWSNQGGSDMWDL